MDLIKYKSDMPPTPMDAKMRITHTNQSIDYNLMHLYDHLGGIKTSLKKMATVDKPAALEAHNRVKAETTEAMQKFDGVFHNKLKGVPMAQGAKGATKKTGTFQGKSNAPGGGGRAAQLKARGLSGGLIGFLGRRKFGKAQMAKWSAAGRGK